MAESPIPAAGERLAKVIARSGLCSRRDAEAWIKDGRVAVNGKVVLTPAFNVAATDQIKVDGEILAARQGTRVWLYHKPAGLVVTEKDPEGRETIFEKLEAQGLPRVVSIGRLDINTEGLLLLTNDGGLKRVLELPATGWLRRYRVRAFGTVTQAQLDALAEGVEIDGVKYGPIEAKLERPQGSNVWLQVALREGKNREVKNVLASLGLQVNRLIRVSFGPFQLGDLPIGAVEVVKARVLRDQLGKRLAEEAGVDFESELPDAADIVRRRAANPRLRAAAPGKDQPKQGRSGASATLNRFRFTDRPDRPDRPARDVRDEDRPRRDRPGRFDARPQARPRRPEPAAEEGPPRKIHFEDGREPAEFKEKLYGKKPRDDKGAAAGPRREGAERPARAFGDKARREPGDRPQRDFGGRPRPPRRDGERPATTRRDHAPAEGRPRRDVADRPKRDFGDRPRPPREGAEKRPRPAAEGARPPRSFAAKPRSPAPAGEGARPARKPAARRDGAAPARGPRPGGSPRPTGGRPRPEGPPRGPRPPRKPRS